MSVCMIHEELVPEAGMPVMTGIPVIAGMPVIPHVAVLSCRRGVT